MTRPKERAPLAISTDRAWIAWAAGLFEGEGWLTLSHQKSGRPCAQLGLSSTDEDVVRRFALVIGGRVTGPHEKSGTWDFKPYWHCQMTRHEDIGIVLAAFWPWLGQRRRARAICVRDAAEAFVGKRGPRKTKWDLEKKEVVPDE